ncbi:hypothetical protein [Variovorax sp. UMC13]|uniref:hypothetical protein n=1 Tax=Variovorax sp. UMC13 TaxID=1862326 RepID=UPI00160381B9|nr:hypothetical protein [Variovorax sp. UMC13]MBB1599937.1 hypothetical protein [Variovorax sp. UMC13]
MAENDKRSLIFKPFNDASFAATKADWEKGAEEGKAFPADVEQLLKWASEHLAVNGNELAYGVFEGGSTVASGICEVIISHPAGKKSWVKLLRLRLHPKVEDELFRNDPAGIKTALNAYVSAVIGAYHVKTVHNASTIKIYGRTQEQMKFLTLLAAALEDKAVEFKASIEGRWLVLRWTK